MAVARKVELTRNGETILFKGGFALLRSGFERLGLLRNGEEAFKNWDSTPIGSYRLHFDQMFACHKATSGDISIVCLGYICDVVIADSMEQTIQRLASAYALSREALIERLSDCGGTFVIFACRKDVVEVFLDAAGTIGVCYATTEEGVVAASHPNMLAELFGFRLSPRGEEWVKSGVVVRRGPTPLPGLTTAFDGIRVLTPNTILLLPAGEVLRIYPRYDLPERPLDEIVSSLILVLRREVEWLSNQARLAVSLSGGLDTRLTLAALRPVAEECLFFTYSAWHDNMDRTDSTVAVRLAKNLGLRHLPIDTAVDSSPPAWFLDDWYRTHGPTRPNEELVWSYRHHLAGNYVHVRSNLVEIARAFYLKKPRSDRTNAFDAEKLSSLYHKSRPSDFVREFAEFIEVTSFHPEYMRNYHYADLFYWEHRMGSWLANQLRLTRVDHHTFILYNCRRLIEAMISVPLENRIKADIAFALIHELWPEALNIPIFSGLTFVNRKGVAARDQMEAVSASAQSSVTNRTKNQLDGRNASPQPKLRPLSRGVDKGSALTYRDEPGGEMRLQDEVIPPAPFIVGTGRCGTTLLRLMLDAHPELAVPSETSFIPKVARACLGASDPAESFVAALAASKNWASFGVAPEVLKGLVDRNSPFDLGAALRTFYTLYARRFDKPRWGDKTPGYHANMQLIQRLLPEARFVHLIRDGRDVALSVLPLMDRSGRHHTPEEGARWWAKRLNRARKEAQFVQHYIEVRYEDLVQEPAVTLQRICEFIELPWNPAMLNYHETAAARLAQDGRRVGTFAPPRTHRVGRWQKELTAEERDRVEEIAGPLLREYGYA